MTVRLHIGDKNYSSWSMRPWLALRHGGISFDEIRHDLPEVHSGPPAFGAISPTGRVPALELGAGVVIAESLAICEWAAELSPQLWPDGPPGSQARAMARFGSAMMHAGFTALRRDCPMNIRRRTDSSRMSEAAREDAAEIDRFWSACLEASGGPYLFGRFTVVDAMYAPVVTRFVTYGIPRSEAADGYVNTVMSDAHVADWIQGAMAETRTLPRSDIA
ncbi:MAG: glutathione S-transferase [Hyphomonadaceae bacterium]